MNYTSFSFAFGFLIWLVGTLAFRFFGHTLFPLDEPAVIAALYVLIAPVVYFLALWVFKRYSLSPSERLKCAILLVLPGMCCDVLCVKYHAFVFPTMSVDQAIILGSWVLWAYSVVLLAGLISSSSTQPG